MPTMVVGKEELVVSGRIEMRDRFSGRSIAIDQQEGRPSADGWNGRCEGSHHVEHEEAIGCDEWMPKGLKEEIGFVPKKKNPCVGLTKKGSASCRWKRWKIDSRRNIAM